MMGWVADTDLGFGGALVLMSVACVLVALVATRLRGPASPEVDSVPTAADVPAEERP
jgi:hypothetical protein